jgi:hypothetical protein
MMNGGDVIPSNLADLHRGEEQLREKAMKIIADDNNLQLQLTILEAAMELADIFRQFNSDNDDIKVIQVLGMRIFNAFGAALKLALSGYHQNSALVLRDVIETVFLLDLFSGDRKKIQEWRLSSDKDQKNNFSPYKVRTQLDSRDGFTSQKREAIYKLFSELAGHPNMKSHLMLRPKKDSDAVIGPFMEMTTLQAIISEMGKLALQAGEHIEAFIPDDYNNSFSSRAAFAKVKLVWWKNFAPS